MTFLKLEDEDAEKNGKKLQVITKQFCVLILAACCYIQTKQSEKWQISMKDFIRVAKSMGLSRSTLAINLCDKWSATTWNNTASDTNSDSGSERSADENLMNYENKPRES